VGGAPFIPQPKTDILEMGGVRYCESKRDRRARHGAMAAHIAVCAPTCCACAQKVASAAAAVRALAGVRRLRERDAVPRTRVVVRCHLPRSHDRRK
jgi:hypothetical protein